MCARLTSRLDRILQPAGEKLLQRLAAGINRHAHLLQLSGFCKLLEHVGASVAIEISALAVENHLAAVAIFGATVLHAPLAVAASPTPWLLDRHAAFDV